MNLVFVIVDGNYFLSCCSNDPAVIEEDALKNRAMNKNIKIENKELIELELD